jgi:hypothetical protein
LQEACVCRRHDSGPIEPDKAPARPARSSLDRSGPHTGIITRSRQGKLTARWQHIDVAVLRLSFFGLKKSAAPGVDRDDAGQVRGNPRGKPRRRWRSDAGGSSRRGKKAVDKIKTPDAQIFKL